ncbi:MAG: chemotaxis response regulator protein-glutamate methylesterase [Clostridiales bacterium]
MIKRKKIKVLIVDDSILFREFLKSRLSKDNSIEIVGTAENPFDARDKILALEPDVITLDVELPKMSGIEFLKRLIPQYPIPVIVASSVSENVFDALKYGALDFVTKPNNLQMMSSSSFITELIVKIKIASTASIPTIAKSSIISNKSTNELDRIIRNPQNLLIAIGASTGGTEALAEIFKNLPSNMPGIVVVQHMPPVFTKMFAERLNSICPLNVKEAQTNDIVKQGTVLIAPGDYHMAIKKSGSGFSVECFKGDKVNGHCPSVDILFNSVAKYVKKRAIGLILTGMGYDGAKGLLNMKKAGARTIGQNERSCIVYGMPKVAYDLGGVEKQVNLNLISKELYSLINNK